MTKGVAFSVAASFQFGFIFYFVTLLKPLTGWEIFGWRSVFIVTFLTLFMLLHKHDWDMVRNLAARVRKEKNLIWALPLSAFTMGLQQWLFVWGPANDKAMEMSIGYFLLPMSMVLCGRFIYKEKLTVLQKIAFVFALVGVSNQLYQIGGFDWATLAVCLGFPPYFILRRYFKFDDLGGLWFDMVLILPVGLFYVISGPTSLAVITGETSLYLFIPLFGAISATALITYIIASRILPLGLFGLLTYVEPVLLTAVGLILGGRIGEKDFLTYGGIWLAVAFLVLDGLRNVYTHHKVLHKAH